MTEVKKAVSQTTITKTRASVPSVAVIVASHVNCFPLDKCVEGHSALCADPADFVFVDNGSGGSLADYVTSNSPKITTIVRAANGYFCGGYNTGLQWAIDAGYEFAVIVNADTEVINPEYVKELVKIAEASPNAAFVGPRVYDGRLDRVQNTIIRYPWFWRFLVDWPKKFSGRMNLSENAQKVTQVEFLNGVCVLCRMSALREVGLMDEVMGGYVEDADWSWRASRLGWQSLFVPVDSIVHHQQGHEYESFSDKSFMLRRNHIYWHMKCARPFQAAGFALASSALALFRACKATLTDKDADAHWRYVRRFIPVAWGLLCRKVPAEWFGPPLDTIKQ